MSKTPILLFPVIGLFEFSLVGYSSATGRIFSCNFTQKAQLIRHRDNKQHHKLMGAFDIERMIFDYAHFNENKFLSLLNIY
jgi:hypothetical protein